MDPSIKTMIDNYKKDNPNKSDIIPLLRWIDTIHDFYPINSTARGEDIRGILNVKFKKNVTEYLSTVSSTISSSLSKDTKQKITPSAVEVTTESFYDNVFGIEKVGEKLIDINQIIKSYGIQKSEEILKQFGIDNTSIEANIQLSLTDRDFFKNNIPATNFLANFILTFFGKDFIGGDDNKVYFLIDASVGRLDCIFQDIEQASTLVNVLTIGDSAVTSVEDKKSKSESKWCGVADYFNRFKNKTYLAGNNALPYNNIADKIYDISSNEFTNGIFKMWYQDADPDKPFSKINNAGARLYVEYEGQQWFSEFSILASGSPNSGTSVGTLKQLIIIINSSKTTIEKKAAIKKVYEYETQFNLSPILYGMLDSKINKDFIINFLYDYKRAGDHEQVNSANYLYTIGKKNVILLTGDRLCSLYARLMNQPCIFIHDGKYDMYRHLSNRTPLTEAEKILREAEKKDRDTNILNARKEVIRTEIENIKTNNVDVGEKLESFQTKIDGLKSALALSQDFENELYSFILDKLLKKIKRIKELNENNKKISDTNEKLERIPNIEELNTEYAEFYREYNELFNFVLHFSKEEPTDIIDIKKFKSNALDYDNIIVKNILKYFTQFNKILHIRIREGARNQGAQIAIKTNIVQSIGGVEFTTLMDDFVIYIKKCNLYENNNANNASVEHAINELAFTKRREIQVQINGLVQRDDFGTQTYAEYEGIFNKIKTFIIENLNIRPLVVEPAIEPIEPIEPAIEPTKPIEPIITEIETIEEINDDRRENEKLIKNENLMEINDKIKATIVEQVNNVNNSLLYQLRAEDTLDYFTNSLNNRLKYEQELFYESESISGGAKPLDEIPDPDYDIQNIVNHYYYNIQESHINLFIYTYISRIDDDDIIETSDIKKTIKSIYRYVLSIYPDNVYEFLYTKQFLNMESLPALMESDELGKDETLRPISMDTPVLDEIPVVGESIVDKSIVDEDLSISSTPPTISIDTDTMQSSAVLTPPSKRQSRTLNKSKFKRSVSGKNQKKIKSVSGKKSINLTKLIKSLNKKEKTENKENRIEKRKRDTSSERKNAIKKARRALFPIIEVGGGKKRTRKYKKYIKIKKTQQNRKKTRKNKTLKKRKGKRNYRTRRN
jgi:hypothetical protein